jgi:hypothetical protein
MDKIIFKKPWDWVSCATLGILGLNCNPILKINGSRF